jgi:hypothetical protein
MEDINNRFAFIEAAIIVHGFVSRKNVQRAFRINPAASTRVFTAYRKQYPNNIFLSEPSKTYCASESFTPHELMKFKVSAQTFYSAAEVMAGQSLS